MTDKRTADDYPWIRKWGFDMGSNRSYIEEQVELARRERAPQSATHKTHEGAWSTIDDILNVATRLRMGLPADPAGTVGRSVDIDLGLAYRISDYTTDYGATTDEDAAQHLRDLVEAAVAEKLAQLGWGVICYATVRSVMPGREKEMVDAERDAKALQARREG
jgi:hypothetical protein